MTLVLKDVDYIKHYGIKGQQWGVRRKNPSGGHVITDTVYTKRTMSGKALTALFPGVLASKISEIAGRTPAQSLAIGAAAGIASYVLLNKRSKDKVVKRTHQYYFPPKQN